MFLSSKNKTNIHTINEKYDRDYRQQALLPQLLQIIISTFLSAKHGHTTCICGLNKYPQEFI